MVDLAGKYEMIVVYYCICDRLAKEQGSLYWSFECLIYIVYACPSWSFECDIYSPRMFKLTHLSSDLVVSKLQHIFVYYVNKSLN